MFAEQFAFVPLWSRPVPLKVTAATGPAEFVVKDKVPEYELTANGVNVTL